MENNTFTTQFEHIGANEVYTPNLSANDGKIPFDTIVQSTTVVGREMVKSAKRKLDEIERKDGTTYYTSRSLKVKKLSETATIPVRASLNAAGVDLFSSEDIIIPAKARGTIRTGIAVALPTKTYGRIAPRSSLAANNGIDVGAGVVDEDYRGEIKVILFNHGGVAFEVHKGDRIAQLIVEKIEKPWVEEVESLDSTDRGEGGFGSTGK